jgi:hypothetical protein
MSSRPSIHVLKVPAFTLTIWLLLLESITWLLIRSSTQTHNRGNRVLKCVKCNTERVFFFFVEIRGSTVHGPHGSCLGKTKQTDGSTPLVSHDRLVTPVNHSPPQKPIVPSAFNIQKPTRMPCDLSMDGAAWDPVTHCVNRKASLVSGHYSWLIVSDQAGRFKFCNLQTAGNWAVFQSSEK